VAFVRRLPQAGWPQRFHLVEFPNAPLAVALAGMVAERLTDGRAHDYAGAVAAIGIAIWSYLELTDGSNWFRRLLGAAGLTYVLFRLA
jgi:hypothetical protein